MSVVRKGGTLMAIEGDHGSTFFHPENPEDQQLITALGLAAGDPPP